MAKIDYQRYALPDIEMYAGNTDIWEFPLFNSNGVPYTSEEMEGYNFRLIIDDYGFVRGRNTMSQNVIVKPGNLMDLEDGSAVVRFEFTKPETERKFGKYTYQFEAEGGERFFSAQGSLYIIKNMNQQQTGW